MKMKKMSKRFLSLCLILSMVLTLLTIVPHSEVKADTTGEWSYEIVNGSVMVTGYNGNKSDITVPETIHGMKVTAIGNEAFKSNTNLVSVVIPDNITSIGTYAFADCYSLASITLSNKITELADYILAGCIKLENIIIPESVTSIGEGAFAYCSGLTSIKIPADVSVIPYKEYFGFSCFFGCSRLNSIDVDNKNTKFNSQDGILYNKTKSVLLTYPSGKTDSSYTFPDSVEYIMSDAFCCCSNLTEITLSESVVSVEHDSFRGCSNLQSIKVDNKNSKFSSRDGVLYNKDKSELIIYPLGKKDDVFIIPNGVTSIAKSAFEACSSLTSINIPDSVKSIESRAFIQCESLTGITIPSSVEAVGYDAFSNCKSLEFAKFMGEKPIDLNEWAFSHNNNRFKILYPKKYEKSWKVYNAYPKQSYGEVSVTGIFIKEKILTLAKGKSKQIKYEITPYNADNKSVKWVSSNTKVATVSQTGVVKATGKGTCTISVITNEGNKKASCKIKVTISPKKIKLNKNKILIKKGKKYTLRAKISPKNATLKKLVWSSSNKKIATVSKGKVKGKRKGTCYIIVKIKGSNKKAKCKVTVR